MEKILSVIVPSYNMEKLLPKCLGSLVVDDRMLLDSLDVIVVNDGSKDRTSEVGHQYETRYPGVFRVVDKPNGNYGSCVNAGLKIAVGKYVKVLDADDYVDVDLFGEYLEELMAADADLILNDYDKVDPDGCVISTSKYEVPSARFALDDVKGQYLEIHAITYRLSNLQAIGYRQTEGMSYTDLEWSILPMALVQSAIRFNKPLVKYLVGRGGQTMEPTRYAKNFWMVEKLSLGLVEKSKALPRSLCAESGRAWLDWRIRDQMESLYSSAVLGFANTQLDTHIFDVDRQLEELDGDVYHDLEGKAILSKRFRLSFVDEVRQHPHRLRYSIAAFRAYSFLVRKLSALIR